MQKQLALIVAALFLVLPVAMFHPTKAADTTLVYLPLLSCASCTGVDVREAIILVNTARETAGCPAAQINARLMAATQGWSERMDSSGEYRHAPLQWYVDHGYPRGAAENIGVSGTAEQIFNAWMASAAHRDNMLSCRYHDPTNPSYDPATTYEIGVGHSNGYWTLALGTVFP